MEITMEEKNAISERLRAYVAKYPSQTKAAGSLKGVSVGTVSNILNGRFENISDEMFRNVASQVGGVGVSGWQVVETGAYQEITEVLSDAQRWRNVRWVTGEAGCGKSTTARMYLQDHKEVFYILCSEDMKKVTLSVRLPAQSGSVPKAAISARSGGLSWMTSFRWTRPCSCLMKPTS